MTSRRRLLGESLVLIVIRALGVLVQLAVTVLVARTLTLAEMGLYALFLATVNLARGLGPLGLDQASTRLLALHADAGVGNVRVRDLSLAGALLALAIAALAALSAALVLGLEFGPSGYGWPERLVFIATLPAFIGIGLFLGQLRGLGHNLWAQAPDALGLQLVNLALVAGFLARGELTLLHAMAALAAGGWLVLAFQLAFRLRLGGFRPGLPAPRAMRDLAREGAGIFQAHVSTMATIHFPTYFAAATLGIPTVAILDIAQRFGNLGTLLTASVGATYNPSYARLSAGGDRVGLKALVRDAGLLAGLPAIAIALLFAVAGQVLIGALFPEEYLAALVPMAIIAAGTAVNALFSPASNVFLMSGRARYVRHATLLALMVVVLGCWLLGPLWGATGVAVAILAGRIVRDGGLAAMLWWRLGG